MQEKQTICVWSYITSVARIQEQNPSNRYPSLSWDHQGKCQSFLETRAGTAGSQAEPHGTGGRSHLLGHLQLLFFAVTWILHRHLERVRQGRAGCFLPRNKMQVWVQCWFMESLLKPATKKGYDLYWCLGISASFYFWRRIGKWKVRNIPCLWGNNCFLG